MHKAQANLSKCPESCAARLPTTGEAIVILNGESGYHAVPQFNGPDGKADQVMLDAWNADVGATQAHVEAMLAGSMFGWHVPGADPDRYDVQGKLKRDQ